MDQNAEIQKAVAVLQRGGLVAFATETVYGLGADATNPSAIQKIFAVKGRPPTNPLIVHIADAIVARRYVTDWPDVAERLARAFWPGPLTLVLPKGPAIVPAVTAGLGSVALRSPDHPLALALLREFSGPIAAPSANRSNRISPTAARHVRSDLGSDVDLILDGGDCRIGIESTVIDLTRSKPTILRPGAVSRMQLENILGPVSYALESDGEAPSASPGRQPVHYAPRTPAFRFNEAGLKDLRDLLSSRLGIKAVFLIIAGTEPARKVLEWNDSKSLIEMPDDADAYGRRLYDALREADERGAEVIFVQESSGGAAWDAVRDRIRRATRTVAEAH